MVLGKLPVLGGGGGGGGGGGVGVLQIWILIGQGPTALTVGVGGYLDIFLLSVVSLLSPSVREMSQYRLKYCLKGP